MTADLRALADALANRRLIASPKIEDDFVYGLTRFEAIDAEVMLNVDPEFEEHPDLDTADFVTKVEGVLEITALEWRDIVDSIATEIEDSVGSEPIAEQTDLRDDLVLASIVVLVDAVLLSFDAPKQFPDSIVRVQLDDDLRVEDVAVEAHGEDDDGETITFENVDELLRHLSASKDEPPLA